MVAQRSRPTFEHWRDPRASVLQLNGVRLVGNAQAARQKAGRFGAVNQHSAAAPQASTAPCNDDQDGAAAATAAAGATPPAVQQGAADAVAQAAAKPVAWAWAPPALPPQQPPGIQGVAAAPHTGDKSPTPAQGQPVRIPAVIQMGDSACSRSVVGLMHLLMHSSRHRC